MRMLVSIWADELCFDKTKGRKHNPRDVAPANIR